MTEATQIVSEFATNAIRYSRSGQRGGTFVVDLRFQATLVRIRVVDQGTGYAMAPDWGVMPDVLAESGRGLALVAGLAENYGTVTEADRCTVTADLPLLDPGGRP
ncbi:ATP-binding protein [Spiractinospora alimapuensis]|nr:ATP-binding protein [Spiractinospora alimapuensis]